MEKVDCHGNTLHIGDRVVYFTKYRCVYKGKIIQFTNAMTIVKYYDPLNNKFCIVMVYSDRSLLLDI